MRPLSILAVGSLIGGASLLAYSVASGESQAYLVLIFPVVNAAGAAGLAGIALLGLGMLLGFLSIARSAVPAAAPEAAKPQSTPGASERSRRSFGGVVFLGPIPIVFGSNVRVSKYMLVAGIVLTVLLLAFFFLVLSAA